VGGKDSFRAMRSIHLEFRQVGYDLLQIWCEESAANVHDIVLHVWIGEDSLGQSRGGWEGGIKLFGQSYDPISDS